jgi:6-phosphogluconolactonase
MKKLIEVLPNATALIERSLSLTVEKITNAIQNKEKCSLALSGGSTPKALYEALAKQSLPWEKIHIFWGDERYVSRDHSDSNQRMARQAWLNLVPIPAENIHPMPTESGDPSVDAQTHEAQLREFFQVVPGEFPALDVVLLGMGDDGHTASLFPQTAALDVRDRLITVGKKDGQPRLTFTIPLINKAHCVIFIVSGENKRPALAQIMVPEADDKTYPSRFIKPQGELWWLLDQAAGSELKS